MAVAVAPRVHAPMFKGDAADMVDRLVAACEQARAGPAGPLKERELVAFDFEAWDLPQASVVTNKTAARASKKASAKPAAPAPTSNKRSGSPPQATPPPRKAHTAACPAFFSPPKPQDLPMPTSLLLRAACVKA